MKTTLKLEEAAMTVAAVYFLTLHSLGLSAWTWVLLFFAPDVSILGYAFGARTGASVYNLFHHKGLAVLLAATGYFFYNDVLLATGILLFAHASFDRVMGYGLKHITGFKDTHLGTLERQARQPSLL